MLLLSILSDNLFTLYGILNKGFSCSFFCKFKLNVVFCQDLFIILYKHILWSTQSSDLAAMSYFGVFLPHYKAIFEGCGPAHCAGSLGVRVSNCGDYEVPPDSPLWQIFTDKLKALNMLKCYKTGRLREFSSRQQAEHFVKFGVSNTKPAKRIQRAKLAKKSSQISVTAAGCDHRSGPNAMGRVHATGGSSPNLYSSSGNAYITERQPHRTPTRQELNQFRRYIEMGHYEHVKRAIWMNPRLLISSGDTPTSLKDGYRYNAMHICAQLNQVRIAELILKVISDRRFTRSLVGNRNKPETCATISGNLLDYYLNMPDNTCGETPLHFAAKNCYLPMVELLISYPQCKSLRNTKGRYPRDVIGQRQWNASPKLIAKLQLLLSNPYYVPVLRACADEVPPQIGQPFTPTDPPLLLGKSVEIDHFVVKLRISALAGPMTREQAYSFYRRWKMPPRSPNIYMSMCESAGEPFTHYQGSGMSLRNNYRERHIKNSDIEKGLEVIGRQLAHQEKIEWREYWDFLDSFMDISSRSGLDHLETYLADKSAEAQIPMLAEKPKHNMNLHKMENYFDAVADCIRTNIAGNGSRPCAPLRVQAPYTYVEKSLAVFARRITKTLFRHIDDLLLLNLKLHTELNRLSYLILSFKDDARFITVDFGKAHSRIAELVAGYAFYSQSVGVVRRYQLMIILRQLAQMNTDSCQHLHCVCSRVFLQLEQAPAIKLPDGLQSEQRSSAVWQLAQYCKCNWNAANDGHQTRRRQHTDTPRVQAHLDDQLSPRAKPCNSNAINVAVVNPVITLDETEDITNESEDDSQFYECYDTVCSEMTEKENLKEDVDDEGDDDDYDDVYYTPANSRDSIFSNETKSCSVLFICGRKPTKRDDDVLLALCHADVERETFPHVYAWLQAMRKYSSVEDKFCLPPIQHQACTVRESAVRPQPKNRSTITMPTQLTTPNQVRNNSPTNALLPWSSAAANISQSLYRKLNKLSVLLKNRKTGTELVAV